MRPVVPNARTVVTGLAPMAPFSLRINVTRINPLAKRQSSRNAHAHARERRREVVRGAVRDLELAVRASVATRTLLLDDCVDPWTIPIAASPYETTLDELGRSKLPIAMQLWYRTSDPQTMQGVPPTRPARRPTPAPDQASPLTGVNPVSEQPSSAVPSLPACPPRRHRGRRCTDAVPASATCGARSSRDSG